MEAERWFHLLTQGALLRANAEKLGDFHERCELADPAAQIAFSRLVLSARTTGGSAGSEEEAVSAVSEEWREALGELMGHASGPEGRRLIEALYERAGEAVPTDPYRELFELVAGRCAAIYGDFWPPVDFALGWRGHPRARAGDPYAFGAVTRPGPPPAVSLGIFPDGFGPGAFAAVPAVFVHECVCHVPARQRGAVSNGSVFAEGFMDWAAKFFFERWMPEIDGALAPAAMQHAAGLDAAVTPPRTPEGAARLKGRRAADKVVVWLQNECGVPWSEALPAVARLAVELNRVEASIAVKDRLVVRLAGEWDDELARSLARYCKGEAQAADML